MSKPIQAILLLPLLFNLAACTSSALRNTPDFKAGYSDGCASANRTGANKRDISLTRDEAAYRANRAYRSGWGTGFGACRQMSLPPGSLGDPLGPPRAP